ncbi:MAG: hypothetical protein ABIQ58_00525 [Candidatus Limnocylindrales bacterium]
MAGYVVSCRVDTVAPRPRRMRPSAPPPSSADTPIELATVDLVGRPLDDILADRWDAFREIWARTTFFLFDGDSWRT